MYRVCGLQLGLNIRVRLAGKKSFYLRLTVEKMLVFSDFAEKYRGITPRSHSILQGNSDFMSKIGAGDLMMGMCLVSTKLEVMAKLLISQNAETGYREFFIY